jgi:hypothetical protein
LLRRLCRNSRGAADGDGAGDEEAIGAADDGEADDARAAQAALAV